MFLSNPEDIESVLTKVQLQGIPLRVRISGVDAVFDSSLLEICTIDETPYLVIACLLPEDGNMLIKEKSTLDIEIKVPKNLKKTENLTFNFKSHLIRKEHYNDGPALMISYPEKRRHLRMEPLSGELILLSVFAGPEEVSEVLASISTGGVGFYTNLDDTLLFPGTNFKVSFRLPFGARIEAALIARWFVRLQPSKVVNDHAYRFFCGAEFEGVDIIMREQILRYITDLNIKGKL